MARQLILTKPISVTVDAVAPVVETYDTVRFTDIGFQVDGDITAQRASFSWSVGKVVDGQFIRIPVPGFAGAKNYPNRAPEWAFSSLIARSAEGGASATLTGCQDTVFADLQESGELGAGTAEDYSMYPPGYESSSSSSSE